METAEEKAQEKRKSYIGQTKKKTEEVKRSHYSRVSEIEDKSKESPEPGIKIELAESAVPEVPGKPKDVEKEEESKNESEKENSEHEEKAPKPEPVLQAIVEPVTVPIQIPDPVKREVISAPIDTTSYGCLHFYEKYPCSIIIMIFLFSLACAGWTYFSSGITYSSPTDRDFLVRNSDTTRLYDRVYIAQQTIDQMVAPPIQKQTEVNQAWTTHLIVVSKIGKSVFSQENIKCIRRVANEIRNLDGIENFCLKDKGDPTECSPIEFMRGVVFSFGDQTEDKDIQNELSVLQQFQENRGYLERDITMASTYSNLTRVIFRFASPITGDGNNYVDANDRASTQEASFLQFSQTMSDFVASVNDPELQFYIYSDVLYQGIYVNQLYDDAKFIIYTIIFLFLYFWIRCQSFFMALAGVVQVVLSFPIAYVFYGPLFGINYIGVVHVIAVYIGLVVSVENMIIFISHWRHSKRDRESKKFLRKRLAFAMEKSFGSITTSTIVTVCAFCSAGISQIVPIASFGYAMAIILTINYFLLLTFYPCVLLFYWKYLRKLFDCIDIVRKLVNPTHEKYLEAKIESKKFHSEGNSSSEKEGSAPEKKKPANPKLGLIETFFENYFAPLISKIGILILIAFLGWLIFVIYLDAKTPTITKLEELLPNSYAIILARENVQTSFGFGDGDENVVVRFVYGINTVDTSNVSYFDVNSLGTIVWDNTFNLSTPAAQTFLSSMCLNLKNVNFGFKIFIRIRRM